MSMAFAKQADDETDGHDAVALSGRLRRTGVAFGLEAIAKQAGVSIATVSRVLNKHPSVRPRTAELVMRAISQLNTAPASSSADAAASAGPSTPPPADEAVAGNVAVVFLGWQGIAQLRPVYLQLLSGIRSQLDESGSRMMVFEAARTEEIGRHLRRGDVDGVITLLSTQPATPEAELEQLAAMVPTVRVMGAPARLGTRSWDHVTPNHVAIGRVAFDHLARQGCRRVAYVSLGANTPGQAGLGEIDRTRALSFLAAAREADVEADVYWRGEDAACQRIFGAAGHGLDTPAEIARHVMRSMPRGAGGLFVSSDFDMAMLYPLLAEQGVRPEADVRLIACDNSNSYLAPLSPRPASIDVRADAIGRQAVLRLMHRLHDAVHVPMLMEVTPDLVIPSRGDVPDFSN